MANKCGMSSLGVMVEKKGGKSKKRSLAERNLMGSRARVMTFLCATKGRRIFDITSKLSGNSAEDLCRLARSVSIILSFNLRLRPRNSRLLLAGAEALSNRLFNYADRFANAEKGCAYVYVCVRSRVRT